MSGAPVLEIRGLEVGYGTGDGGFRLRVDALDLRAGEVLAVLGPNGAGKSTLLRAMAGLIAPRSGSVSLAEGRDVSLVFQRPVPFSGSVAYNAELPLWARGVPRAERRRRADASLREFGIGHLARQSAATLSGGELRRLALARAFAGEPSVLLLDEPFDDLDPAGREGLSLDVRSVIAGTDVAVAMVTHDLRQALLLADRVAVLWAGRLVQAGPRDELLRRPAGPEVARLLGMENLLPGRQASDGSAARVQLGDDAVLRVAEPLPGARDVWVGIRPENVKLAAAQAGPGDPLGRARVARVVSDGLLVRVWLEWSGLALRTHLVAGRGLGHSLKEGDAVWITIRPEDVHLMPR